MVENKIEILYTFLKKKNFGTNYIINLHLNFLNN